MVSIIHKTSKNLKSRIIQHDFTLILNINFPHFRIFYGKFYLTGKTKSARWYPVLKGKGLRQIALGALPVC